ncbi:PP2C family protein-serine/threonine phosphatase [Catellatospora citrea]|uniref:Histidine kinase n=1 Tax=Catellatospora citrea TaxID=53366 RepID=A0A8J3KRL4_9ACTN|nr:SpoIIE family protein phosphatase [Catellatospora citrea]RKE05390.1 sigma-B regulation protein RsbU (phosphoserine phosphatase) [Catellatospora citrea]GIG00060.1 histidine kinase [Catellatospora citrea]
MSSEPGRQQTAGSPFPAMLEDNIDDLYEHAPCGNLTTLLDGTIAKVNATLLDWLGYTRDEVVGVRRFADLLTVGGKLYHETHYAPLLALQGEIAGIALELRTSDGRRLPVLVSSTVKTGSDDRPQLIRTVVFDARDRRAYEQELLRARQAAEQDRERLRHLVAALQASLLPDTLPTPPAMTTAAHYHMASPDQVGGDFYDLFALDGDRWGFFLGDVCGKGIEAAAITALARYTLRAAAVYDPDPAAVISNLNTVLYQEYRNSGHRYCTVVFGVLSSPAADGSRTAAIAGGGHPAALLTRADGSTRYQNTTSGPIVGIIPEAAFTTNTLTLRPGDTLLLYSDGILEARSGGPETMFGEDALREAVNAVDPADAPNVIVALITVLAALGDSVDDDVALMALGISDGQTGR